MKFRIKYADQVVGIFVILAFALLALIMVAMGSRQRWFARDYKYFSRFTTSAGLSAGTPLLYKGFQVGRIVRVRLNDENVVDVNLVVFDAYADRVRENSLLELVTSPIGLGSQLLFHPGRSTELQKENTFIPSLDTPEGQRLVALDLVDRPPKDDTIARLMANVNPLVENVNSTIVQLEKMLVQVNGAISGEGSGPIADAMVDAAASVAGVKDIIDQVNTVMGSSTPRVSRMMADVEASLPDLLARVEESAESVMAITKSVEVIGKNFEQTSDALRDPTGLVPKLIDPKGSLKTFLDDNNQLFDRVDNSFAHIEKALGNLEGTTATLSTQMPRIVSTIDEARSAIVKAQDVMEGLKNNPLLKGGIPERVDPQAAPTSLRTTDF